MNKKKLKENFLEYLKLMSYFHLNIKKIFKGLNFLQNNPIFVLVTDIISNLESFGFVYHKTISDKRKINIAIIVFKNINFIS
jgi:hypothetical protein